MFDRWKDECAGWVIFSKRYNSGIGQQVRAVAA